jgi:hypothetical protein
MNYRADPGGQSNLYVSLQDLELHHSSDVVVERGETNVSDQGEGH